MEFDSIYDISQTVEFIVTGKFTRVGLQFPDTMIKIACQVERTLREELRRRRESGGSENEARVFLITDTTCCVNEVRASQSLADALVHYGHTCLSPISKFPTLFVFGKSPLSVSDCVNSLINQATTSAKSVMVLYGLEYGHKIEKVKEEVTKALESRPRLDIQFADILCSTMSPSLKHDIANQWMTSDGRRYNLGGLVWKLPKERKFEDYLLFWIGSDNSAFENAVLTFNGCEIVRYDAEENCMVTDFSQQRRILKRRYYLVEKAKDANIVGILVGTPSDDSYLHVIDQMKELIEAAGKKANFIVTEKPNPEKLANFREFDVVIHISCAETALLESKEYLAPLITPFEAMLAFDGGRQWTGEYILGFQDLIKSSPVEPRKQSNEARFSFFQGGYVEDTDTQETETETNIENDKDHNALANVTEKTVQLGLHENSDTLVKRTAKSGAEFLATRSYQGLEIHHDSPAEPYLIGRSGRAAGYEDER